MHMCVRVCLSIFEYVNLSFHTNPLVLIFFFLSTQAYKRKTEAAKKEYLKALAAYRASLVSKVTFTTSRLWQRLFPNWMENPC